MMNNSGSGESACSGRESRLGQPRVSSLDMLVFAVLFISFGWFAHGNPGWNANSRMALSVAWATTGHSYVDGLLKQGDLETGDLAVFSGNYYSDKSIGTSIIGVPAVLAEKVLESAVGHTFTFRTRAWLITMMSVAVTGAVGGVLLMRWLGMIWNISRRACALLALGVMLGTMLFHYSTLFMSYGPATMCLLGTLILIETGVKAGEQTSQTRRVGRLAILAGIAGGLTILCEYLYAAGVGLAGLYFIGRSAPRDRVRVCLLYGLGCIIGDLPFLVYSTSIFGRPSIPYEYHMVPEFRLAMSYGLMGAVWPPKPAVLWLTSFHPFRGLFFYSPMLLGGLAGIIVMFARRQPARRSLGLLCVAATAFYFIFNACYYMWWGGWSFSPRHLAPAIPFLAAGLGLFVQQWWGRVLLMVSATWGIAAHLMVVATEPQVPDGGWQTALLVPNLSEYIYPNSFARFMWPRMKTGDFDWNLGSGMGLTGWWTLVPLVLVWAIGGFLIWRVAGDGKLRVGYAG